MIFDYQGFLSLLSDKDRDTLSNVTYSYSTLYDQNGIGVLQNPHHLLETGETQPNFFRYNGKALPNLDGDMHTLFKNLETEFKAASSVYGLNTGDLIIINQNKNLHGRLPIHERSVDNKPSPSQDRFLLQTYIRH